MTDVPAGAPPPIRRQRHLHLDDEVWQHFCRIGRGNASQGAHQASRIARAFRQKIANLRTPLVLMASQLEGHGDFENATTLRNLDRLILDWQRDAEAWF